jgi:hypothetical protein
MRCGWLVAYTERDCRAEKMSLRESAGARKAVNPPW